MVHTGPKTEFGGEKEGLTKVTYQVGIEEAVKTAPIIPAPSQRRILNNKSEKFFILNI